MNRRSFLIGLAAGLAPAVIRTPGLLMPVKALIKPESFFGPATVIQSGALRRAFWPGVHRWFGQDFDEWPDSLDPGPRGVAATWEEGFA